MKRKSENEKRKLEKCKKNKEAKKEGRNAADGMVGRKIRRKGRNRSWDVSTGDFNDIGSSTATSEAIWHTSAQAEDALAASGLASQWQTLRNMVSVICW